MFLQNVQAHGATCPECRSKDVVSLKYCALSKNHTDLARLGCFCDLFCPDFDKKYYNTKFKNTGPASSSCRSVDRSESGFSVASANTSSQIEIILCVDAKERINFSKVRNPCARILSLHRSIEYKACNNITTRCR